MDITARSGTPVQAEPYAFEAREPEPGRVCLGDRRIPPRHSLPSGNAPALHVLWPQDRVPVSMLLDDCIPCRNPAWYEFPEEGHRADIPNSFVEQFAAVAERTGVAGKFSVVPCPGGQGRVDQGLPGVDAEDIAQFLRVVRERIAPRLDVSPELLTHNRAMDLGTMQLLSEREDRWAASQNEASLTAYVTWALQILCNAGLAPTGVTSPWAFGQEVETAYQRAIATLRAVCGVALGWYFLHVEGQAMHVVPQVVSLDRRSAAGLVSIASGCEHDFSWETQAGLPADPDLLISADGTRGRLAELIAAKSPATFHTHWQALFSNGSGAGLAALEEVCTRVNRHWGGRIRWTSASELSTYAAAAEATRVDCGSLHRHLRFRAPIPCNEFTFRLPLAAGVRVIRIDGKVMAPVFSRTPLAEGSWRRDGQGVVVCMALRDGTELAWQ